jgi:exopolysaccharide biosynthesis polyprenyl glycosylphosphotransferase
MIGTNIKALKMVSYIKKEPKLGFNFVGFLLSKANTNNPNQPKEVIGNLSDCEEIINKYKIDRFIIWDPTLSREELMNLTSICSRMDVELNMVPDLLSHFSRKIDITQINGYPIISLKRVEFDRWDIAVKRIFDLVIGSTSLILLFPFMVIIAILIKLDSKGPIFYIQERLGRGGRYFKLYKFRSMYEDADRLIPKEKRKEYADGYLFKILDDPRITKVGRFLRRYSIDELPQLINVLKGEMSLVGPRPLPVVDIKYLEESEDYRFWSIQRGNVLPGITGLWQVSGRSNLTFEEMAELDIYYVEEWSIWLDIKILLKTIPKVISGEGAY